MSETSNLKICMVTLFIILVCVFPFMTDTADIMKVDEPLETEYRPPMAPEDIGGELNGR